MAMCHTHYMIWHYIDQACSECHTVSVCGSAVAAVPVERAASALETTASGTWLSLMLCELLTLPNHIVWLFLCHNPCSFLPRAVADILCFSLEVE